MKMENADRQVTQDDVARHAGVTRSVVSYVLSGSSRTVAPKTREKILKAIEVLGYRPNKFAQGLLRAKQDSLAVKQIGIVLNGAKVLLRPYYSEILAGIHDEAHENSYHIRFIRFFSDLKNPILFNELIHHEEICGLILVSLDQSISSDEDRRLIEQLKERIKNTICVEWQNEGLSSVSFDRQEAAFQATKYLLEKGYSDIAYIGEADNRIIGFKNAFHNQKNVDINALEIAFANDMRSGFHAIDKLFLNKTLPAAILAGSDEVAIGILRYLNMNKIDVPEKIAIASIDNIEMAEFTNPPLTTVNVQKSAMGKHAVQLIIKQASEQHFDIVHILLPTNLIVRQSS